MSKKISKRKAKKMWWRKDPSRWQDTLFDKKLLRNPSLMTNLELATALQEYQEWRRSVGKYDWDENPVKEGAEMEAPFSPQTLGRLIDETIARLHIGGDLAMGRLAKNGK